MDALDQKENRLELCPGVEYLPEPRFEGGCLEGYRWKDDPYYRNNRKEFQQLQDRYGADLENGCRPALTVRTAGKLVGAGLYAAGRIPADTFIGEYTGIVRPIGDESGESLPDGGFSTDYAWGYPARMADSPRFEIDALRAGNHLRFVNHSFQPNCTVDHFPWRNRWVVFFRSLMEIAEGEQLLVDYGEEYWSAPGRELVLL